MYSGGLFLWKINGFHVEDRQEQMLTDGANVGNIVGNKPVYPT
jgi:hypothetical protein